MPLERIRSGQTTVPECVPNSPAKPVPATLSPLRAHETVTVSGPAKGAIPAAADFLVSARTVFHRIDRDNDGYLSKGELTKAFHDPQFKGREAAAVVTLGVHREELQALHDDEFGTENDGVTLADLKAFEGKSASDRSKLGESGFASNLGSIGQKNRVLFPQGLASITPSGVQQGEYGDCYLMSAITGMAAAHPKTIRDMIVDNGNGTVTVKFPGQTVTIDQPTDAEMTKGARTPQGAWVAVLEKAYAKVDPAFNSTGFTGGIRTLTGHSSTIYVAAWPLTSAMIVAPIKVALSEGRLVVASRTWTTGGGLPSQHVYAVIGYDAKSDTLTVRNPWGDGGPANDGIHHISPADFRDQFDLVGVQDR